MTKTYSLAITFGRYDGIIARMALVTERRGYSIEDLSIKKCTDDYYCMNLKVEGEEAKFQLVCNQLQKLVDVISLEVVSKEVESKVIAA